MEISCFLSVARTGSFTVSARELSSTQQAVSRNIQSLEEELGFPLLNRGGAAVTLTWAGQRFMQWRIEHDAQLSTLERQSRRLSPQGADELYVAWNDWTGCPREVEEGIREFCRSYPNVRLHTRQSSTEEVADMLFDGNADIAILPENSTHEMRGLIVTPAFLSLPLYVVSRDLESLPSLDVLSYMRHLAAPMGDRDEEAARRRIGMFCAGLGITPKRLDVLPNIRSTFTELLCGSCYTVAPGSAVPPGLRKVPLPGQFMRLTFVTQQGRVSPWASLFESFMRQRGRESQ